MMTACSCGRVNAVGIANLANVVVDTAFPRAGTTNILSREDSLQAGNQLITSKCGILISSALSSGLSVQKAWLPRRACSGGRLLMLINIDSAVCGSTLIMPRF